MAHRIEWREKGVYVKYEQHVELSEIREVDDTMYKDFRYQNIQYQIVDFIDVQETAMKKEDVNIIAGYEIGATMNNKEMKVAFVANNPFFIELIHLYIERLTGMGWTFQLFEMLDDAEKWCLE